MGDTETLAPAAPPASSLTRDQLDDLASLLARCLGRGNIEWLARAAGCPEALQRAGNQVGEIELYARGIVEALHEAGRVMQAVELLFKESHRNGMLTLGLKHILGGRRLGDDAAMQAFVNQYEPFLGSAAMMELLPRVGRAVCAVALGEPWDEIRGSGFLIAPDAVITNYHVMKPYLDINPATGDIRQTVTGDNIFLYFDYMFAPPPDVSQRGKGHTSVCVNAARDWLLRARVELEGDGKKDSPTVVSNELDYVVIKLDRPVGKQSSRSSGGAMRGWLPPPESIDMTMQRRILVFQHPEQAEQQFDIGDYVQLDPSSTRVWYSVSTAHGSSGGAAVDTEGQLFALHNAAVEVKVPAAGDKRVNQGVRIDYIARDLASVITREDLPPEDSTLFWSLNDDLEDPRPIIGRTVFRDMITQMSAPDAERVLVVTGPPRSGLQFSIKLLRRTLGRGVPVAVFTPKQLQEMTPQVFVRALVENLGVAGLSGNPLPRLLPTENVPRWLRLDLPKWLLESLTRDQQLNAIKYPAWVVINTVVPEGESFLWADNLRDLVATLVGVHDGSESGVDLHQLRWLFLAKEANVDANAVPLPVGGVNQLTEDLGADTAYVADHTQCLQRAWRANNKEDVLSEALLRTLGEITLQRNNDLPAEERLPPRKVLANHVREIIKTSLRAGGGGNP